MFKKILVLVLFLSFGWLGASKSSNENLPAELINSLFQKSQSETLNPDSKLNLGELLVQLGVKYYAPTTQTLADDSETLVSKLQDYCSALEHNANSDIISNAKTEAENSWHQTMLSFHKVFAAPFGPLYDNARELSNNIYSWPLMNECGMHVELVEIKNKGQFTPNALYTSKGLMAVEFALFKDLNTTTCNTRNQKFAPVHAWLKLGDQEKALDMCKLALVSAQDVVVNTNKLTAAWDVNAGNHTQKMVDGSTYESFNFTLNRITDGIFTMIEVAKDTQLGKPMGLHRDCLNAEGKCVDDIEHKWSQTGLDAIEAQFIAFKDILNQGGLGAHLNQQGHPQIYKNLIDQNDVLLKLISDVKTLGSLNEQVEALNVKDCANTTETNHIVPVCAIQRQIRVLVHTFRSELFPALHLTAPLVYQGDAD